MKNEPQTIVIVGPTASGKSDLAILLAQKHQGEIISADSRQVYRGMDIGSGKVTKKEQKRARHWLIDVSSPKRVYSVSHFIRDAKKALINIRKRGKVPIVCGGTGFWVQALLENTPLPKVKPDAQLRKKLGKKTAAELFSMLQKKDPSRAKTIDSQNKVRLIRALEIASILGSVPKVKRAAPPDALIIALNPSQDALEKNISERLKKRLRGGMVAEARRLRAEGVSWRRMESFGLEYKNLALFLQKKISEPQMKENILRESRQYAKRQLTWLRRWEKMGAKIHWLSDAQDISRVSF